MPVPKRKRSRARRDKRFANKGITPKAITLCQTCQAPIATHIACQECGYYKGIKVLRTKTERMRERGNALTARHEALRARQSRTEAAVEPSAT